MSKRHGHVSLTLVVIVGILAVLTLPGFFGYFYRAGAGHAFSRMYRAQQLSWNTMTDVERAPYKARAAREGVKCAVLMSLGQHIPLCLLGIITIGLVNRSISRRLRRRLALSFSLVWVIGVLFLSLGLGYWGPAIPFPESLGPAFVIYLGAAILVTAILGVSRLLHRPWEADAASTSQSNPPEAASPSTLSPAQASTDSPPVVSPLPSGVRPPAGDERYMPLEMREEPERHSSVTDYVEHELEKRDNQGQNSSEVIPFAADGSVAEQGNAPKAAGRVTTCLGWILFVLAALIFVGLIADGRGYPRLGGRPPQIIGYWLGLNAVTLCAFLLALYAGIARKNQSGRVLLIASGILLVVSTALSAIPTDRRPPLGKTEFTTRRQVDAHKQPSLAAKDHATSNTEELAVALSQALDRVSQKDIKKEFVEKIEAVPTVYTSSEDGFSVIFPKQPTFTEVAAKEAHTHNYQAYSVDGSVSYNVFFTLTEKKILASDSQAAFLKDHLVGRLLLLTKPQVLRDDPTTYNGLPGRDYTYIEAGTDPPILFRGLVFLLDGDAVSLSMLHAKGIVPQYSFEDFVASFRLLPLPANLSDEFWQDAVTGLRLRLPADMKFVKGRSMNTGLIATFANTSGHSLSIFHVSSAHPGITMAEAERQLGSTEKDKEGWYRNRYESPTSGTTMLQLMRLFETPNGLYMVQGFAPEKTFFRSETKIRESARTLGLPAR